MPRVKPHAYIATRTLAVDKKIAVPHFNASNALEGLFL